MRNLISAALVAAALAACASTPQPPRQRTVAAQQDLDRVLAGKVAGAPRACLPLYKRDSMTAVDDNTLLFHDGANRVWRNDPPGGCPRVSAPGFTMVIRTVGSTSLCRGEIVQIIDLQTNVAAGTCTLGDFVPYTRSATAYRR